MDTGVSARASRRVAEAIVAAGDQVVLVLEDLHWADASTRDLLLLARTSMLLVITCRTNEFAAAHPVAALLAERLHLAPLDRAEVAALAGAVLGTAPADHLVDALMVRAASVHVSNILRNLGLKSRIQAASLAHRQLPHT